MESSTDVLAPILAAMSYVGGPEVIAYCFALAENEAAPWLFVDLESRVEP